MILVVALAASIAAFVAWRQQVWTRQVENLRDAAQGEAIVHAGVDWAGAILAEDRRKNSVDHLEEPWAQRVALPVERGKVAGGVQDAQSRFNLNNLVRHGRPSPEDLTIYRRLLETLGLSPDLADALADWLDADTEPNGPAGAEDAYYQERPAPYLAGNRPLADVAELLLVRGYEPAVVEKLTPHVHALPQATLINVNTAGAEVLAAAIDGLSLEEARRLVEERGAGDESLEGFSRRLAAHLRAQASPARFGVASDFFEVELEVEFGRVRQRHLALFQRQGQNSPLLIWLNRRW